MQNNPNYQMIITYIIINAKTWFKNRQNVALIKNTYVMKFFLFVQLPLVAE